MINEIHEAVIVGVGKFGNKMTQCSIPIYHNSFNLEFMDNVISQIKGYDFKRHWPS